VLLQFFFLFFFTLAGVVPPSPPPPFLRDRRRFSPFFSFFFWSRAAVQRRVLSLPPPPPFGTKEFPFFLFFLGKAELQTFPPLLWELCLSPYSGTFVHTYAPLPFFISPSLPPSKEISPFFPDFLCSFSRRNGFLSLPHP